MFDLTTLGAIGLLAVLSERIRRKRLRRSRTELLGYDVVSKLGKDKYLGGEVGLNGCIYCVPGTARYVLKIHPKSGKVETIGPQLVGPLVTTSLRRNQFKWLRAIRAKDGVIYGIPSNADRVLRIIPAEDPDGEDVVELIGPSFKGVIWKWHGGNLAENGIIYAIPCNHKRVLCIDTNSGKVSTLPGPDLEGRQKWYGGLYAPDGCIYGIPNCADKVIRIDPKSSTYSTFGNLPKGGYKWHGGLLGSDGNVYGFPSHAETVLKIVPKTSEVKQIPIPGIQRMISPFSNRVGCVYKFGGGVMGPGDCAYAFPSDSDRVLCIHLKSERASLIGPRFVGINKWQNGFLGASDGAVYGIPCNAARVIRIDRSSSISLIGDDLSDMKEKWEGGVVGDDGALYCMPQQAGSILRIFPKAGEM